MRHATDDSNYRPQCETEPRAEERAVGDRSRESAQRSVFAAKKIISKVQRAEHVERTTNYADQCEGVSIDRHAC